jgi:hypothetical protein
LSVPRWRSLRADASLHHRPASRSGYSRPLSYQCRRIRPGIHNSSGCELPPHECLA